MDFMVMDIWIVTLITMLTYVSEALEPASTLDPLFRTHDVKNYCENEMFRAACASDEIIVMKSAFYGRMDFGRCIDRDYGYVGCKTDVLIHADRKCSGLRTCEMGIPYQPFTDAATCPKDLKPYLSAGYQCLKVDSSAVLRCRSPDGIRISGTHGYIASVVTQESNAGSLDCPWVIEAEEGQRINVTLHDFGTADYRPGACHAYAILRENINPPSGGLASETICNSNLRKRFAYLSKSNRLDIRIIKKEQQFLLEYEVVGCPDIKPTSNMFVKRKGDEVTLQCTGSETRWSLKCEKNKWIGKAGTCVGGVSGSEEDSTGFINLPFGISVAVIIIIALVIGTVFMVIGLMCLRWRRKAAEAQAEQSKEQFYTGFGGQPIPKGDPRNYYKRELPWPPPPAMDAEPTYAAEENEYSYIAELPPPPSSAGVCSSNPYPEPPKYFEFDPNVGHMPINGDRYVVSGGDNNQRAVIIPSNSAIPRRDVDLRQIRQARHNSTSGQENYSSRSVPRTEKSYKELGQNHVSI